MEASVCATIQYDALRKLLVIYLDFLLHRMIVSIPIHPLDILADEDYELPLFHTIRIDPLGWLRHACTKAYISCLECQTETNNDNMYMVYLTFNHYQDGNNPIVV
ncbi:hypothetical protein OsI_37854 [Oryza sativa Indica Group]|uniref:Uncharacterized protein n=1 Tax=Oryza sativa subsp. indica TaxID=39946 RepID=A2ZJ49_ORYSI|nr:hypothetical protein OsI_37854 [Oryza sativa Indica Group]